MTAEVGSSKPGGRAALLRNMIEEKGGIDGALYAANVVSYRPWDVVAQALAGAQAPKQPVKPGGTEAAFSVAGMFSNPKITVEQAEEEGDEVRLQWRLQGTHAHAFNGIAATGEQVNATGHTTYRFAEDKIVAVWGAVDCSSLGALCPQTVEALTRAQTIQGVCLVSPDESIQPRG
jgi:SnoaL-like polyketide cyclase